MQIYISGTFKKLPYHLQVSQPVTEPRVYTLEADLFTIFPFAVVLKTCIFLKGLRNTNIWAVRYRILLLFLGLLFARSFDVLAGSS